MDIVMVGPFGLRPKHTMRYRALPMAQALVERGNHVTMLLPPWTNREDAGTAYIDGGVQIINLSLPPRVPVVFELALTIAIVRRTIALKPRVVHCFKPKAYAGLVLWCLWHLRLLRVHRCRLVVDSDDWEGAGGWNEREGYSPLLKALFAIQERWCLTHADAVSVASRTLESLAWSLGVRPEKVGYVPNGATTFTPGSESNTAAPAFSDGIPQTVLLYTRFIECNVERMAQILCALWKRVPGAKVHIAGKGMAGEEDRLAARLKSCAPPGAVTWLGWLTPAELGSQFAHSTVAIYPLDDNLVNRAKCSVKAADLLSAGVATVAEAVGQMRDYIQHGVSGWLVTPGDESAFVAGIVRLLEDAPLRERIRAGAAARMRVDFGWGVLVPAVERLYAS